MTNEFKDLTDGIVIELYHQARHAYRTSPRIMPANDRMYLLRRREMLWNEINRRRLILI